MIALSNTVLVIGPTWSSDHESGNTPRLLTRPYVGFIPTTPQKEEGMRTDPPVSVPREPKQSPAAVPAADPLLDPPVIFSVSYGFLAGPTWDRSPVGP